jgi:PKD repeat protein
MTSGRSTTALPPGFLDIITPEKMAARISHLQSFGTRFAYSSHADEAAEYIFNELNSTGLTTSRQTFFNNGFTLSNVIAVLPGRNASLPWCVVGAHYDSINGTDWSFNPYAPAPGADDDASGVAAMLGIAEAFARAPTNRTVVFAAFAAEEQGRVGSTEFVRQLKENDTKIAGALCIDMIGYNDRYRKVDIVTNSESLWLARLARDKSYPLGLLTEIVVNNNTPYRWSDQVSFWEAGYPAMYFIEDENPTVDSTHFSANPYYHTGDDTLDKLNLSLMTSVARLGASTLAGLAGLTLPDLRPVLRPRPRTAIIQEPVMFNVSVQNTGEAVAVVNVSLLVDGEIWENRTIVPDGRQYVYFSWVPTAGSHRATIVANMEVRYVEWVRSDNTLHFDFEVNTRPDLYVSDLWASDSVPLPGQKLWLYAWVGNSGGTDASGKLVVSSDEGGVILDRRVFLPAGETRAVIAGTFAPSQPVVFSACITQVQPWELDESDNGKNTSVVPHIMDVGGLALAVVPEAAPTLQKILFEVQGDISAGGYEFYYDFGDGSGAGWTGAASFYYVYPRSGTFNASIMVRDAQGAVAALASVPVLVLDQHPVPIIETDGTAVHVGTPVSFSSDRSYDPDGIIEGRTWEFGDGGVALGQVVAHTYNTLRSFTVRLTVMDDEGFYNITTLPVTAMDDPPAARMSASSRVLFTGENASFNASGSTDRDGRILAYEWSFGDANSSVGQQATHSFSAPGRYIVRLTVRDDLGVSNDTSVEIFVYKKPVLAAAQSTDGAGQQTTVLIAAAVIVVALAFAAVLIFGRMLPEPLPDEEE